jgi:Fibronectin type III domain
VAATAFIGSTLTTVASAWAGFSTSAQAAHTLTSATLQPPAGLSATTGCSLLIIGPKADLQWTASPSLFASGYKVERWRGSTLQATTTVTPRTTVTLTQTGLSSGTTYTWRVYAFYQSWTSAVISASGTTPSLCL